MIKLRSSWLLAVVVAIGLVLTGLTVAGQTSSAQPMITVYKTATCGCCGKWVNHLEANGFTVKAVNVTDLFATRTKLGVPPAFASCHTGVVGGYLVEGHVPAEAIKTMLAKKPAIAGIAVPGMPMGSPGMEGPNPQSFSVVSFTRDGKSQVVSRHQGKEKP